MGTPAVHLLTHRYPSRGFPCASRRQSSSSSSRSHDRVFNTLRPVFVSLFALALVKSLIIHTDAQNYDRPTNTLGNITIPALCKSPRGSVHPSLDIVQKKEKGTDNGRDRISRHARGLGLGALTGMGVDFRRLI